MKLRKSYPGVEVTFSVDIYFNRIMVMEPNYEWIWIYLSG
jgi:hypothetical protein